jgi:hypothetical protein
MWSELTTVNAVIDCRLPFSFYFGIVRPYWQTPGANNLPLHRICTLARKQGATHVIVESALGDPAVRLEITALDEAKGGGGAAEAIKLSFFVTDNDDLDLTDAKSDLLGQATIINYRPTNYSSYTSSYVFEAILSIPSLTIGDKKSDLLNNYIPSRSKFECDVRGKSFEIDGIYYCQQNGTTNVCAHASLRMALRGDHNVQFTSQHINDFLKIKPPLYGLQLRQIIDVIQEQGHHAEVIDCTKFNREEYISMLASIVESGGRSLLVFTTGHVSGGSSTEHVVPVFGHTRNSDEWHPQAIPMYAGPASAQHYRASSWIDHFVIHDDNFGPYYTLSSQALEFDPDVKAHWIVAVRSRTLGLLSIGAEAVASLQIRNLLPSLSPLSSGQWFDYVTNHPWTFVLRTILIGRDDYIEHLKNSKGHDGSAMLAAEIDRLRGLPDELWMVEFSLPALFTGNHSKLGEVLVSTDAPSVPPDINSMTLGVRLPNLLLVRDPSATHMQRGPSSLLSHSRIYNVVSPDHEW